MENGKLSAALPAALLAFDSEALQTLLDEVIVNYDLTFGYHKGLRKVTLTDRRDKLRVIGYRTTWTEALSYVLDIWRMVETLDIAARIFAPREIEEKTLPELKAA